MALANTYLTQSKNLGSILDSIRSAQAPERFTTKFLEALGFKSTNDRLIIPVLKALGFIDESGAPKQRYFRYLDQELHRQVMAEGIREAYSDLFALNTSAHLQPGSWVKNKLNTLTQGSKSEAVLTKMATTFTSLVKFADFTAPTPKPLESPSPIASEGVSTPAPTATPTPTPTPTPSLALPTPTDSSSRTKGLSLAYNIHVELPAVRDQAVYDAIFRSLKENLL